MAPKSSRRRHGRPRGRPAPRLEDDLKRFQLAREVIPQLVETMDGFLEHFPLVAERRVVDRISMLCDMASDVLAWTALGAPRGDEQLPARCFAASCFLDGDPHRISWQTLAMSGIGGEVAGYLRTFVSEAIDLPTERPDAEFLREMAGSVIDETRAFKERLEAQQATSSDGRRVGRQLLFAAIALDPLARDGKLGSLAGVGAIGLMERTLPTGDPEVGMQLAEILEELEEELPGLIDHAAAHLEEDEDELLDEEEPEDEEGEDEEALLPGLDDVLSALDARLRLVHEASEGADLAYRTATALLAQSMGGLRRLPATVEAGMRVAAAAEALLADAAAIREAAPLDAERAAALETMCLRAAALLEADVPGQPREAEPVELQLSRLDELVAAMQDVADLGLVEDPAGLLALIGGATQTLQLGVGLGHPDADTRGRMAAALGALDPLALADLPDVRRQAAQTLRDVARSQGAAVSRPHRGPGTG